MAKENLDYPGGFDKKLFPVLAAVFFVPILIAGVYVLAKSDPEEEVLSAGDTSDPLPTGTVGTTPPDAASLELGGEIDGSSTSLVSLNDLVPTTDADLSDSSRAERSTTATDPSTQSTETARPTTTTLPDSTSRSTTSPTREATTTTRPASGTQPTSTERPSPTNPPATQAPTTAQQPSSGECGGDSRFSRVYRDDFNRTVSNGAGGSWQDPYYSAGNSGFGLRRPSAISVNGDHLVIKASMQGGQLVSGGIAHTHGQTYGRYEARVKTEKNNSSTSALVLTWPVSDQHREGENNMYETLKDNDGTKFFGFIHKPTDVKLPNGGTDQVHFVYRQRPTDWHTIVMEWMPDSVKLYSDGQQISEESWSPKAGRPYSATRPHSVRVQLDAWRDSMVGSAEMRVDYIEVCKIA